MAQKYRCPVCGATHKSMPQHCRLCGQDMGPEVQASQIVQPRYIEERRSGLGVFIVIAVVLVLAVAGVFVALQLIPGTNQVEQLANKAGLSQTPDGWSQFVYPEGGVAVDLPEGTRTTTVKDGLYSLDELVGKETHISITAERLMPADEYVEKTKSTEQDPLIGRKRYIRGVADDWEATFIASGGKVDKRDDEAVGAGSTAVYFEVRNVKDDYPDLRQDVRLSGRVIMFVKDGVLYTIRTTSVYDISQQSQFDHVLSSFSVVGPPKSDATSSDTSAASAP
jgi:hypothetical protein